MIKRCVTMLVLLVTVFALLVVYNLVAQVAQPDLIVDAGEHQVFKNPFFDCYATTRDHLNGIYVSVANQGDAPTGPFVVSVYGVWQAVEEGLAPGEDIVLWYSWYGDPSTLSDAETAQPIADVANQVPESNEDNNTAPVVPMMTLTAPGCVGYYPTLTPYPTGVPTQPLADLAVEAVVPSQPKPYCAGQHSRDGVRVTIANQGDAPAGPFILHVNWLALQVKQELAPGESAEFWVDLAAWRELPSTVDITIDSGLEVEEYDETNNRYEVTYYTPTPPDPCE
jgi:hypothetical protein